MKKFKNLLLNILEAKLEPGGEDAGKLFGPRGKFRPEKAEVKEPTFNQRMRRGQLTPNPDRPEGMEELLRRNPPEEGEKEGTAFQRIRSGEIDYELKRSASPKPKKKKPSSKKSTQVDVVTNNIHHDSPEYDPATIREQMKKENPGFLKHSDRITGILRRIVKPPMDDVDDYSKHLIASDIIHGHLEGVEDTLYDLDKKGLPIGKKYGKARINNIQNDYGPGTISLKVNFGKLKTHINSSGDIDDLISHLNKKTGHNWYVSYNVGDTHIGTHTPLSLRTDIHHPWLLDDDAGGAYDGFDGIDDDDDDRGGGRDKPKKPKSPSGPAFPTPTRPKAPALT